MRERAPYPIHLLEALVEIIAIAHEKTVERKHLHWLRHQINLNLRAKAGEHVYQEVVVVQTGFVRSVISNQHRLDWDLSASACNVVQEVSEPIKGNPWNILTCDLSFSAIH